MTRSVTEYTCIRKLSGLSDGVHALRVTRSQQNVVAHSSVAGISHEILQVLRVRINFGHIPEQRLKTNHIVLVMPSDYRCRNLFDMEHLASLVSVYVVVK